MTRWLELPVARSPERQTSEIRYDRLSVYFGDTPT